MKTAAAIIAISLTASVHAAPVSLACKIEQDATNYLGDGQTTVRHSSYAAEYVIDTAEPSIAVNSTIAHAKFTNGGSGRQHITVDSAGITMVSKDTMLGGFEMDGMIHFDQDLSRGSVSKGTSVRGKLLQHSEGTITCERTS